MIAQQSAPVLPRTVSADVASRCGALSFTWEDDTVVVPVESLSQLMFGGRGSATVSANYDDSPGPSPDAPELADGTGRWEVQP